MNDKDKILLNIKYYMEPLGMSDIDKILSQVTTIANCVFLRNICLTDSLVCSSHFYVIMNIDDYIKITLYCKPKEPKHEWTVLCRSYGDEDHYVERSSKDLLKCISMGIRGIDKIEFGSHDRSLMRVKSLMESLKILIKR